MVDAGVVFWWGTGVISGSCFNCGDFVVAVKLVKGHCYSG